ncbi:hypothetical protein [Pseudomonas sp. PLMAX]|uniref:hypothetical protein n=1 Tax=Pseudomonas sp. PLMAX TaxID=2201998 RepID=UPI0038B845F7
MQSFESRFEHHYVMPSLQSYSAANPDTDPDTFLFDSNAKQPDFWLSFGEELRRLDQVTEKPAWGRSVEDVTVDRYLYGLLKASQGKSGEGILKELIDVLGQGPRLLSRLHERLKFSLNDILEDVVPHSRLVFLRLAQRGRASLTRDEWGAFKSLLGLDTPELLTSAVSAELSVADPRADIWISASEARVREAIWLSAVSGIVESNLVGERRFTASQVFPVERVLAMSGESRTSWPEWQLLAFFENADNYSQLLGLDIDQIHAGDPLGISENHVKHLWINRPARVSSESIDKRLESTVVPHQPAAFWMENLVAGDEWRLAPPRKPWAKVFIEHHQELFYATPVQQHRIFDELRACGVSAKTLGGHPNMELQQKGRMFYSELGV